VAHLGEKAALRLVGGIGCLARRLQLAVALLEDRRVRHAAQHQLPVDPDAGAGSQDNARRPDDGGRQHRRIDPLGRQAGQRAGLEAHRQHPAEMQGDDAEGEGRRGRDPAPGVAGIGRQSQCQRAEAGGQEER
jgi:hypothetical protein